MKKKMKKNIISINTCIFLNNSVSGGRRGGDARTLHWVAWGGGAAV
jgi:hypothetical protein